MSELPIYAQKMDSLNQIILDLYSNTSKGTEKYINFLKGLQGILYFDFGSVIFFMKTEDGYEIESFCQIGWEKRIEERYLSAYYKDDDVFQIFEKKSPIIMRNSDIFDETRTISKYYKNFIKPAGFDRSLECNIILPADINSYGMCSLFRKIPKQDFNYEEKKILEFLQPHLSNRACLDRINEGKLDDLAGVESHLFGTLILNQNGDIQHISEGFKKILFKYNKQRNLQECIKEIFQAADRIDRTDSIGAYYQLNNIPEVIEIISSGNSERQEGIFYCNLYDIMGIIRACLKRVEKEYHMTSMEMKILECILQGMHREEISKEVYISIPSVKKYIASIYRKMDITNRMDILVRLGITTLSDSR